MAPLPHGDGATHLGFETLTYAPIDHRLIDTALLGTGERDWLKTYHSACRDKLGPLLSPSTRLWLEKVTQTC
jgi:Xaa-Pro aminopeptidase